MEILVVGDRLAVTQQQDPQIRNPNFMRQQFPQIRQRNPNENQIRPPFQENIVTDDVEENNDHIHCLDKDEPKFYIRKEDHDQCYTRTTENNQDDLRNKTIIVNKDKNKSQGDCSPISQNKNDSPIKQIQRKEDQRV